MKNKVILIIGASGSGKSTIENTFLKKDAINYGEFSHIVSYATRKPRINDGEINGKDYYFITSEEFEKRKENNEFIQIIEHAGTKKGSSYKEWKDKLSKGNIIMPVLLESALVIKKNLSNHIENIDISIIYIDISKKEALKRMLNRYLLETKYSKKEFIKQFNKYNKNRKEKDINNIFEEINLRLKDIELLSDTKKYTNYIINVDNKEKKEVYNDFLQIINKIFNK